MTANMISASASGAAKIIPQDIVKVGGVTFLRYQWRWWKDRSRIKMMEKSRQIGISWASAYDLVREGARKGATLDAWASSRDEIQARLFLEDCKKFATLLNIGADDLGEQVLDEKGNTSFVLRFANGTRIHSMSSSPDAQAGKRGSRYIDEYALHKDQQKMYSIAYPGITWGGQLMAVTTHRGSATFFNQLVREVKEKGNPKKISLHTVTLRMALDDGFLYMLQSKLPKDHPVLEMDEDTYFDYIRSQCVDEEQFLQEFMCVPADDTAAFLPYEMICACEYAQNTAWEPELDTCGDLYVGVDIGRTTDLTAIVILERIADTLFTRRLITLKNQSFSAQEEVLYDILQRPNVRRCCIDQTGIGRQFTERAQERFDSYKVEGVTFSGTVKESLAYPLRARCEDKTLRIPYDLSLRSDFRAIKKTTTAAGNIRFEADRSANGHADRFWAYALAVEAAKQGENGPALIEAAGYKVSNTADPFTESRARDGQKKDTLGGW